MIILFSDYSFWETRKCFTYVSLILATTSCLLKWHNYVTLSLPLFWTMVCKMVVLKLLFLSKALVHSESGYKQIRTSTCWGYKPWFVHLLLNTNFKNVTWCDPDMKKGTILHVYHLLCFYVNHPPPTPIQGQAKECRLAFISLFWSMDLQHIICSICFHVLLHC